MKRILFLIIMVLPVITMATGNSSKLPMGGKAMLTEIKMDDISGAEISLAMPVRLFCNGKAATMS